MNQTPRHAIIPGTGRELIRSELVTGFSQIGLKSRMIDPDAIHRPDACEQLGASLGGECALYLSVNFQGLSSLKNDLETLKRINCRPAVWFVDNPWNILSGVRDPRWKELPLFVTDASFIGPLQEHGANRVYHLPLGTDPEIFSYSRASSPTSQIQSSTPFLFIGRSAFPGKDRFFADQDIPESLYSQAKELLLAGKRPDFSWWVAQTGTMPGTFWPGKKARKPGLGAEESNLYWRSLCIHAAADIGGRLLSCHTGTHPGADHKGVTVVGDAGWRAVLPPGAALLPPIDYYAPMHADLYRNFPYALALTSLQLPSGLNQRHFDIWAAGGVCLTDATPGLDIFPTDLTRPITFTRANQIEDAARQVEKYGKQLLVADWKQLIHEQHLYKHRALHILETLERHPA